MDWLLEFTKMHQKKVAKWINAGAYYQARKWSLEKLKFWMFKINPIPLMYLEHWWSAIQDKEEEAKKKEETKE